MPTLSVVMPVYNERAEDLRTTLGALASGLPGSAWSEPELILVDDGSDPPVSLPEFLGLDARVIRQKNLGRFEARCHGIKAARGEYVLLLDSRVTLDPRGIAWVAERVAAGDAAWNGHCEMGNLDSPYARFWNVLVHSAFADYLDDPRTTSFGISDYDRFPKGTGHFLAPRQWLLDAIAGFDSRYDDSRFSSDDTHLLRAIASRDRIHISPEFSSVYRNRETLRPFLTHALHRGTTFYDGFARRGARFFPVVVVTPPGSLLAVFAASRAPRVALWGVGAASGAGALFALYRGRPVSEAVAFGALITPFAVAYTLGIWRGAWLALTAKGRV